MVQKIWLNVVFTCDTWDKTIKNWKLQIFTYNVFKLLIDNIVIRFNDHTVKTCVFYFKPQQYMNIFRRYNKKVIQTWLDEADHVITGCLFFIHRREKIKD